MKKLVFILMFLVQPILLYDHCDAKKLIDSSNTKIDTVILSNITNNSEDNYISKNELIDLLVKKSSSESWLTVLITSLGVLFAIMAIVVAIVIFKQNHDYKNKINESLDYYKNMLNTFIESKRQELKIQEESIKLMIANLNESQEKSDPDKEVKINEIITGFENQKEIIEKQLYKSQVDAEYLNQNNYSTIPGSPLTFHHICPKCGQGFLVRDYYSSSDIMSNALKFATSGFSGYSGYQDPTRVAACPKCGNVDKI